MKSTDTQTILLHNNTFIAQLATVTIGHFPTNEAAQHALQGAVAVLQYQEAQVEQKALERASKLVSRSRTALLADENLPTGIHRKGNRYVVRSPYYLGMFGTLAEALDAQAKAPRKYRRRAASIPFEERVLTLKPGE